VQIEPTAHFHPQLASKAEKVFPIPLNRKILFGKNKIGVLRRISILIKLLFAVLDSFWNSLRTNGHLQYLFHFLLPVFQKSRLLENE